MYCNINFFNGIQENIQLNFFFLKTINRKISFLSFVGRIFRHLAAPCAKMYPTHTSITHKAIFPITMV